MNARFPERFSAWGLVRHGARG
ncbi:MAG: hypothetical protein QOI86_2980, partial [Actinomycetota bacterium]|nr:hypothetical protein [Actinomycetota bacterium]